MAHLESLSFRLSGGRSAVPLGPIVLDLREAHGLTSRLGCLVYVFLGHCEERRPA